MKEPIKVVLLEFTIVPLSKNISVISLRQQTIGYMLCVGQENISPWKKLS